MAGLLFGGIKLGAGRRQHVKRLEQKMSSDVELSRIGIDFGLIWRGCTLNWQMQEHKGREIAIERKWDTYIYASRRGQYEKSLSVISEAPRAACCLVGMAEESLRPLALVT